MQYKQSELFYWDGAKWVQALTHTSINAVMAANIQGYLGNPRKLVVTLSNAPKDFTSSSTTDQTGFLSGVFTDYQGVLLRDGYTHQITFFGRIYKIDKRFNPAFGGNTIHLDCFDALAEVRDYPTKALVDTASDSWDRYELSGKKRSAVIEDLINYGVGQGSDTNNNGSGNFFLANALMNLNSTDRGTGVGTRFRFEESAVTIPAQNDEAKKEWFRPNRGGQTTILDAISGLSDEEPHTNNDTDKSHGYNYFVDPNMTVPKPVSGNWTENPPSMLNYYKRGTRPTTAPGTTSTVSTGSSSGLTLRFGTDKTTVVSGSDYKVDKTANLSYAPNTSATLYNSDGSIDTANDGSLHRHATKVMLPGYEFNKPSKELYTHAVLTYNGKQERGTEVQITVNMELLYVSDLEEVEVNNEPFFKGRDFYFHANVPNADKTPPAKLYWKNSSNNWTALNAYAHSQSAASSSAVSGSSTVADYESIIIGVQLEDQAAFETQMAAIQEDSGATAIQLGIINWNGTTYDFPNTTPSDLCKFNSTIKELGKGRARNVFSVNRPIVITNPTAPTESLRNKIKSALVRTNMDIRRGEMSFSGAPFYSLDLKVQGTPQNGSGLTGWEMVFDSIGSSTTPINLTTLGVKVGMTVQNFGTSSTFADEVADNNASDYDNGPSFGYITAINANNTTITTSWTHSVPADNEYVQIHIPLRTGDLVRVENPQEQIAGNHIITHIDFEESMGTVQTTIKTVGRNEDVALTTSLNLDSSILSTNIRNAKKAAEWGWDSNSVPAGQQPFRLHSITFTRDNQTRISWDSGLLEVGGKYYSIAAGTTTSTNGNNALVDTPIGSGTAQHYYIYFNKDVSTIAFKTSPIVKHSNAYGDEYIPDGDNVIIAVVRAGVSGQNALIWKYGENPEEISNIDTYKDDPSAFIGTNKITAALSKKGAQAWSTDLKFEGTDFDDIRWGHKDNIANAATISFGDDSTESINADTETGLAVGTHWIYKSVDTGISADLAVTQTYSEVFRANTDRVLMATVVVAADEGQGSPTIFPINGNTPTLSVGAFAANSITSDHITTNSLTGLDIQGATIHTLGDLSSGVVLQGSSLRIYNSGDTLGSGERLEIYDSAGGRRLRVRSYSSRDFGINFVPETAGFMLSYSGSVSGTSIPYGLYSQHQGNGVKTHLGYIFNGYGTESFWGTANAPTSDKVYGWGGLLLAGDQDDSDANTRYLHLLHGGTSNYKIVFPSTLPSDGKVLQVKSGYADGVAELEWAANTGGVTLSGSTNNTIATVTGANALIGESNLTFDGTKLEINGRININAVTAVGAIPTSEYGMFRYTEDGGLTGADSLAFATNLQNVTSASNTANSVFWIMQSTGNFLHFEPNLDYGTSNWAWIGNNNPLVGVRGYYMQAGNGTAANPSISFYANYDNGFWHNTSAGTGTISMSLEGTEEYQWAGAYFRNLTDADLGTSSERWDEIFGVSTNMSSDIRLKENIVDMTNGLDIVNALKPIEYTRIPDESKIQHFGFSAQHVKEVMLGLGYDENTVYSEEYSKEKDDTDWGIKLPELIAPLVSAIQELSEKVKKLEEEK